MSVSTVPGCRVMGTPAADSVLAGRYRLIERIGGERSGVWRCRDLDLDDEVVIKLLPEDLAETEEAGAGLRREARVARRVTHTNIARVFEFGRSDGFYFLTMEHVAGETLRAGLDRGGPLPPAWVLALAVGLCRGLEAALVVGAVHGAIRPGHIVLAGGRGAVLTGLGIAGAARPGRHLSHVAPEQLRDGAVTPRSDVFALGVVLFEALTGRLPWPGPGEATLDALYGGCEPDLLALAPELPVMWRELIGGCLQFDPQRRPADVRSLLVRLGTRS